MSTRTLDPYVPRILLRHLVETPEQMAHELDAAVVFVDISGFTKLSERLARAGGREGAERLSDAIGSTFEQLLRVAYRNGGSLLKFGGDALLLLFEGDDHAERACGTALAMRQELRDAAPIESGGGAPVRLRMSVGVHCGAFHFFVVGGSHRELLIAGPAVSEVGLMEKGADAGQIVASPAIAALLPVRCTGGPKGDGVLLLSAPEVPPAVEAPKWEPGQEDVAGALSPEVRAHVRAGRQPSEHRTVTVAFLRFEGTDALVAERGPEQAARVLEELVALVGAAADERQVCFLGSDIDVDAGKIILTAGAPRATGDEEERMLLVLRRIVERGSPLPVRIGVHRGALFAGDIGPAYRRTYTVMGDVVNLAARLMAKCPPGEIYATAAVLERSRSRFEATTLEPFMVKGKAKPVHAFAVGPVLGSGNTVGDIPLRLPLMGRERELDVIDVALADAGRGEGRLVELVSEPGMGRSRLMDEVHDRDDDFRVLSVACEAYTLAVPYGAWRGLLRELLGLDLAAADAVVLHRLHVVLADDDPGLLPWIPLLAIAMDVEAPSTPEVDELAPEFRAQKLREVVLRFLRRRLLGWALIEWADAQFMDEASAELLHELERQLPLLPWLVVVGRRDTETGFVASEGPHLVRLDLEPLTPEQALALAEAVTEDTPLPPHLVHMAVERSGGSPQFLRDLLRAAVAGSTELPDSIEAAALARIDRLRPADRDLVRRASVLGMSFHPRHLARLLDPAAEAPTQATWDRLDAYFAQDASGDLRFRRELVREVAYAGLAFRVRRELHATAGAHLEAELGERADTRAARLCEHFLLAGQAGKAWCYARVAAGRAEDRFAFADATLLHRRALEAASRFDSPADAVLDVWEKLGTCLARTGELAAADEAFRAARRLLVADPVHEARLLLRHAQVAERAGRLVPAVRWANRGLRVLDGLAVEAGGAWRAQTLSVLATVRQRQGRIKEAIRICEQAIREAEATGEEAALAHACFILDWALFDAGRPQEATYSARALEIYERLGELDRQAAVLNNMGGFAYHEGRWGDAVDLYRRAAEVSERAGDVANAAFGDCNVGEVLSDQGRWDEAEERLRQALRVWRGSGYEWGAAFARAMVGRTAVRAGRHEEGLGLLDESLADFRRLGAGGDAALVRAYMAEALVFRGEPASALEVVDRLLDPGARMAPLLHRVRGLALVQQGERRLAEQALEASLAEARAQEADFETALTLDVLDRLPASVPGPLRRERREERNTLLSRLDVVLLPDPPLRAGTPAAPAAAGAA